MGKWKIVLTALFFTLLLVPLKFAVHHFSLDKIAVNNLLSSFIGGVIFTIAIVFSGVLSDFKESEKIPGELAGAVKYLRKDLSIMLSLGHKPAEDGLRSLSGIVEAIIKQFESNDWKQEELDPFIRSTDAAVEKIAAANAAPPYIIKMRNEINAIERLTNRIEIIEKTDFLPAAYAISQATIGIVAMILLFLYIEPFVAAVFTMEIVVFLLLSLLLLIKDMDNPFETGEPGSADVDLRLIYRLRDK